MVLIWGQWGTGVGRGVMVGRMVGQACCGSLTWALSHLQHDIFHPHLLCVIVALPHLLVLVSGFGYLSFPIIICFIITCLPPKLFCS